MVGVILMDSKYREMPYEELYKLSLQRDKKGHYTRDADFAYYERQRRSKTVHYANVASRCSKYQADMDYYGGIDISNR